MDIHFNNKSYQCLQRESVLEALIRQGERVRFSCKQGVCKTCKLELLKGDVPRAATRPFEHLDENYFLPCLSILKDDISIKYPDDYEYPADPVYKVEDYELVEEHNDDKPQSDLGLYLRVSHDDTLINILTSFYTAVYKDEKLSPFFSSITKQRAIEKQYNFLIMLFSGEEVYMGARPRNAHHWMVISDELFDYREKLMEKHMRLHGLEEMYIERWLEMHEYYRSRMVKDKPWHRIQDGHHFPLEGLGHIIAEVGMVCDSCSRVIEVGETAKYHLHTGHVFCVQCHGQDPVRMPPGE